MHGWIGHLHNRYLVTGASTAPAGAAARLDRLARERLPEIWAQALDEAFGDDPTVYVIRRVETRVGLNLTTNPTDRALALNWGVRLTRSVLQTIADGEETGNLVRFADQADFVAHFAADLARGLARERWYYFAFARFQTLDPASALATLLGDDRAILPRVLARLHELGQLDVVVRSLRGPDLGTLWAIARAGGTADPTAFRPLFAAALTLADRLGLWLTNLADREPLFLGFASSVSQPADWRDARGLATVVVDALGYLVDRGMIRRPHCDPSDFDAALSGLDWLDLAWLRDAICAPAMSRFEPTPDLPMRPTTLPRGLTARQRSLLDNVGAAIAASGVATSRHQTDRAGDILRLYAALISLAPRWMGDPAATSLIERLLAARDALGLSRSPTQALRALARGDVGMALRTLPESNSSDAVGVLKQIAGLGEPGVDLLRSLAGPGKSLGGNAECFATRCAGVFLLLRAVLDVRLASLVLDVDFPPIATDDQFSAILLALAARWAGDGWRIGETVDPGLMLFSGSRGLQEGAPFDGSTTDRPACARFQGVLLRALSGLRLIGGTTLDVRVIEYSGGLALVAGDPAGLVRPLGRVVSRLEDVPSVVAEWSDLWAKETGEAVETIACDPALAAVLGESGIPIQDSTLEVMHVSSAILGSPRSGRIGRLDADLTLDLTASALLRLWAVWLRKFAGSSVPYLLENFVRRPGRVLVTESEVVVELEPGPMDVVLEMSGYLAAVESVPWLGRRVAFQIERGYQGKQG